MAKVEGITIDVGIDDKFKLRLRAIAKHAEALVDELDAIDAMNDEDFEALEAKSCVSGYITKKTAEDIADALEDFPTRLEGSM